MVSTIVITFHFNGNPSAVMKNAFTITKLRWPCTTSATCGSCALRIPVEPPILLVFEGFLTRTTIDHHRTLFGSGYRQKRRFIQIQLTVIQVYRDRAVTTDLLQYQMGTNFVKSI